MPTFRENRTVLVETYGNHLLNDEAFLVLHDVNKPNALDLPYWQNPNFDLENVSDLKCLLNLDF